jgi:hypothetical protein
MVDGSFVIRVSLDMIRKYIDGMMLCFTWLICVLWLKYILLLYIEFDGLVSHSKGLQIIKRLLSCSVCLF